MRSRPHRAAVGWPRAIRHAALLLLTGLAVATSLGGPVSAQNAPADRASVAEPYAAFVTEAARRFGIPAPWIRAVMHVESRGDVRAISPKGAMGLMQLMPDTWSELRARYALGGDPYDPRDNILAGAAYLREMHDRYGSPGFLAAYNAGPGRYEDYRANGRALPAETRAYVAALVPVIGGRDFVSPITVAAADPLAWTRAPLFVAQPGSSAVAESPHDDGALAVSSPQPSARETSSPVPPSDSIFVLRTASAGPR